MEIINTEGIVLGEVNYSESSKILKVFTKDYGLISIISKGCRNLKSKLRGVSNKLSYARFSFNYKIRAEKSILLLRMKRNHSERIPINFASSGQQEVLWLSGINCIY